ncbi:RES family NAD+ phosphorylase [Trinickia caryophylli]|uniref:RES domain-containing protein n=1 Tax=Trinickia caryophylli TaxID=28094 RepID=A0A1X7EH98_TRICW|nr:RES family NAD+ phosphorylase [Trinickia caryophylli]PMS11161.1 RES domain-containing protein [Trinickia caryophylli]TRX14523.1 RES domain-containing protein [Trinickia caryophylli]WQE14361.1 RES family NAD+ phosphorylase [Trinickia caryophylli]SMF33540.1 RES domain-containing protein [Trinickia caryophylli]
MIAENRLLRWRTTALDWSPAYRVIPTRFPAVNLFDRVASPEDFEALYALEAMTNDRLRTEVGELDLVPAEERRFGPGYGPIMAAFTHLNPLGSRFSDGSYGVFYCAREARTAIAETRYHAANFLAATQEPPMRQQMRLYSVIARGQVVDLRGEPSLDPAVLSPSDYTAGRALGREVRDAGASGIAYPSVRDAGGECLAALKTTILRDCHHAAYLEYNWNGNAIDSVFELNQVG